MLQDIRDNSQGVVAKIIIGVICAVFALFGVESILGGTGNNKAAEVNGEPISLQELNDGIKLRQRQLISQMGDRLDPSMLEANRLIKPVLDSLVERSISLQHAGDLGFAISDAQLSRVIAESPQFQVDGVFSQDAFNVFIQNLGLTAAAFKQLYESELILAQYSQGLVSTAFLTSAEADVDAQFTHQQRDIRFIELNIEAEQKSVNVNNDEVQAYYETNSNQFMSPERVQLEYIELNKSDFVKEPTEAEIKAAYDLEVASLDLSPVLEVAHILIDSSAHDDSEKRVAELQAEIESGKDFAILAQQYSDDFGSKEAGGYLGQLNADIFPAEFVAAAEILAEGEVSAPVKTDSGIHIIKVTELIQPEPPSFESRQEALAQSLSEDNAEPAFWGAVEELKDISFNSPDLTDPAKALGVKIQQSLMLTRDNTDELFSSPAILEQAFSNQLIDEGVNSEVIELSASQVLVIRVLKHEPKALKTLDAVKTEVESLVLAQKATESLQLKADSLVEQLKSGETIENAAKSQSQQWQAELGAKRMGNKLPPALVAEAFSFGALAEGERYISKVSLANGNIAIFEVSKLQMGKSSDAPLAERNMMQSYLAQSKGARQFSAVRDQQKEDADIELYR